MRPILLAALVAGCGSPSRGSAAATDEGGAGGGEAGGTEGGGQTGAGEAGNEGEGEGEGEGDVEIVDPFGTANWTEKLVERVFVEPDCTSAERQRAACDPWLAEERAKVGDRWRVGFCEVYRRTTNHPLASPPPTWECQLRGRYVKLVEEDEDQDRMTEWDLSRMYEGRDCEFLDSDEGKAAKRDCEAWIDRVRDRLGEHVFIASCQSEPFRAASGVQPCRYIARIKWIGYPPTR